MAPKGNQLDQERLAKTVIGSVQETLKRKSHLTVSQDPDFTEKEIIEYQSRMRTFGLEKFNGPCYLAAVNYYLTQRDLERTAALGAFILYLEKDNAAKLLKALGYSVKDEEEGRILDTCAELCKIIGEQFKNDIRTLGYKDLIISDPIKGQNDLAQGVPFRFDQQKYCECHFHFWKEKALVVAVTLAPAA